MCDSWKLLLVILMLNPVACTDSVPGTEPFDFSPEVQNAEGKLRLDVPGLMGWGTMSEVKMTIGDTMELLVTLEDPSGKSVPNQPLLIASESGNFFTEDNLLTDHNGQATSLLLATITGTDRIIVTTQKGLAANLLLTVNDLGSEWNDGDLSALEELPGVVSWKTLSQVNLIHEVPHFHQDVEALNGQQVKVQGFMMPLEQSEKQKHFLLSVNPPSCFFCLPAGAEGLVEVYTQQAVEFSADPIVVSGTLRVLKNDEMGLFYRMPDAEQVKL